MTIAARSRSLKVALSGALVAIIIAIGSDGAGARPPGPSTTSTTAAPRTVVLADQLGGTEYAPGSDPISQRRPDGSEIQSAADDFDVPTSGTTWIITSIEVGGIEGPAATGARGTPAAFEVLVREMIWGPVGYQPGAVKASFVAPADPTSCCVGAQGYRWSGSTLPTIDLGAGRYWLSVVAIQDDLTGGTWSWRGYSTTNRERAMFHTSTNIGWTGGWSEVRGPHDLEMRIVAVEKA